MRPDELDTLYTALAEAIAGAGESRTPLLLATLSLDLISRMADPALAAEAIARAARLAAV